MTRDADLHRLLDELNDLLNEWDPIGVVETLRTDGIPLDEYRSYAPGVLGCLERGAATEQLAEHLHGIAHLSMGLSSNRHGHMQIALKICKWYRETVKEGQTGY